MLRCVSVLGVVAVLVTIVGFANAAPQYGSEVQPVDASAEVALLEAGDLSFGDEICRECLSVGPACPFMWPTWPLPRNWCGGPGSAADCHCLVCNSEWICSQ